MLSAIQVAAWRQPIGSASISIVSRTIRRTRPRARRSRGLLLAYWRAKTRAAAMRIDDELRRRAPSASSQPGLATTLRPTARKSASVATSQARSSAMVPSACPPGIGVPAVLSHRARSSSPIRTGRTLLQASPLSTIP